MLQKHSILWKGWKMIPKPILRRLLKVFLPLSAITVLLLIFGSESMAGSLNPSSSPVATSYTLGDIYLRLTTNATANEANHLFAPGASPASSLYTLKQIYDAIPTISAAKVLLGTPYLGVTGTLTPDGGTAAVADLFNGKTANLTNDWNLDTGTLDLACNTATFNGALNLVPNAYDGSGGGNNRWCMTDSGDAATSDIALNKIAWVDGQALTGTLYGDTSAAKVLTTATYTGAYNAASLSTSTVKQGTSFGVSSTGALTPNDGTATVADLFAGATANLTADWTPDTGALNLACNTATFNGTLNLVPNTYDGSGDGTNRWCMTDSGDAAASDILSGKKAWVDGSETTGSIATRTLSAASETVAAGYYNATTLSAVDSDLTAAKIMADVNIFGITGTLLKNLYNGSAGSNVADYAFYTQTKGGVDDYNNNGTIPSGSYQGTWTTCAAADYCGTSDANANKKDNSTGLIWSNWLDSGATHTWFWANNCYEPGTAENPDGGEGGAACDANGDNACQCVKKPAGSKVGCEALGSWRLPYQKELMQAYINGSWANLSNPTYSYWSSTTVSNDTYQAWCVGLVSGYTNANSKTTSGSYRARCVYAP